MKTVQAHALTLIELLPVQLFNPVMSVAALAMVWQRASETHGAIRAASSGIGIIALALFVVMGICYGAKLLRFPGMVKQEFKHPELGAAFAAVGICVLLISRIVGNYSTALHLVLWGVGAVAALALNGILIFRLMNGGSGTCGSSAWLLTSVASLLVVSAGTPSTLASARELNFLAAGVGGCGSILFLLRRIVAADKSPSLMVVVAPFALGFVAYVNLVQRVDMVAGLLFYCALFLFAVVGSRLALQPALFSLAWWDIGFPMAALANAALIYAGEVNGPRLQLTAALLLLVLTISIVGLSVRTVCALCTGRLLRV